MYLHQSDFNFEKKISIDSLLNCLKNVIVDLSNKRTREKWRCSEGNSRRIVLYQRPETGKGRATTAEAADNVVAEAAATAATKVAVKAVASSATIAAEPSH